MVAKNHPHSDLTYGEQVRNRSPSRAPTSHAVTRNIVARSSGTSRRGAIQPRTSTPAFETRSILTDCCSPGTNGEERTANPRLPNGSVRQWLAV
jgi:hypothetical protein